MEAGISPAFGLHRTENFKILFKRISRTSIELQTFFFFFYQGRPLKYTALLLAITLMKEIVNTRTNGEGHNSVSLSVNVLILLFTEFGPCGRGRSLLPGSLQECSRKACTEDSATTSLQSWGGQMGGVLLFTASLNNQTESCVCPYGVYSKPSPPTLGDPPALWKFTFQQHQGKPQETDVVEN